MISVETKYVAPSDGSETGFVVQITKMVDSYMVWVGSTGKENEVVQGRLCRDWAYAMPATKIGGEPSGTSLFRSNNWDIALSMAQRMAKRTGKAIHLSVDIEEKKGIEVEKVLKEML
ncbi:hypothetical protein ARMGADRAFT_1013906, partial [Armillaria gallica]